MIKREKGAEPLSTLVHHDTTDTTAVRISAIPNVVIVAVIVDAEGGCCVLPLEGRKRETT